MDVRTGRAERGDVSVSGSTPISTLMAPRHASQGDSNVLNRPRMARLTPESRASGMRYQIASFVLRSGLRGSVCPLA